MVYSDAEGEGRQMKTVGEISKMTGISVRALHHYDEIGLLKPARVTDAGYRLYDDDALERLQHILMFRELQFSLKEIGEMLDAPDFDTRQALETQIRLLEMQREHLEHLIAMARQIQKKGGTMMDLRAFNQSKMDEYKKEAKAKWGNTEAWQAYEKNEKQGKDFARAGEEMMALFAELGKYREFAAADESVQQKIAALQNLITENFYPCTREILRGLGRMYTQDERFRKNIDAAGGEGTAAFAGQAIEIFCSK